MTPRPVFTSIFALCVCACVSLSATDIRRISESWRWVRFGHESGLPSERVTFVLETHTKEVWARSSPAGMVWFDGYRWNRVRIPGLEHQDQVSQEATCVEDSNGILVFHSGAAFHVDRDTAYFNPLTYGGVELKARNARMTNGAMVFAGDSMLFRLSNGVVQPLPSPYDAPVVGSDPRFLQAGILHSGKSLVLKAGHELYRYTDGAWVSFFHSPTGFLDVAEFEENEAGQGMAVIQTETPRKDVYVWNRNGPLRRLPDVPGDLIRSYDVSPDGDVLILFKSGSLLLYHKGKLESLPSFPSPVVSPIKLRFSSNGDLWVCTERGLFLCRLTSERWSTWETGPSGRSQMVNSILKSRDGSFWIGTAGGLCVRTPEGKSRFIREINGKVLTNITGLAEDEKGSIWIGSGSTFRGTYRWDGRTWRHFGAAEGLATKGNTEPFIHNIVLTRSKQLWFCGIALSSDPEEPGAFRYADDRFERISKEDGLIDGRVYSVIEDRKGALWFGSKTGLSRLDRGSWKSWRSGVEFDGKFYVYSLAVDSSNNIWIGRKHNGLICIDTAGSVRNYTTADGLVGNSVWDIQVDSLGFVWIGTREGIGCYDGKQWMSFDVHTGLPNSEIWPIFVKDRRVYAGLEGAGVAVLSLDHLNDRPPRIRIESPLVEDERVTLSWVVNAFWADVPATQIETRYCLEGGKWSSWSTARTAVFKGLPHGAYRLYVEPRLTSEPGSSEINSVSFSIPPPLYLRPIVGLPIVVLALLVMALTGAVWDRKRRYDRSIRDSEARFRAQYRSNPVPTFTWKHEGDEFALVDINDAGLGFLKGYDSPIIGRFSREVLKNHEQIDIMIRRCFAEQSVLREEFRIRLMRVSREADVSITFSFVYPDMVLTHVEDVTERKRSEARIRESREELRALASRLESVREEERTQLSREIHDELGQLMTGLKMDLAWIRKRVPEQRDEISTTMHDRIQQMNSLLDQSIQTVRKIAGQLRPALLDELGLVAAMEWQAKEWESRTGISCHYDALTDEPQLRRDQATELFRIFQELLTNVARHARASEVTVVIYQSDHELCLEVRDNGRGIREEEINRPFSLGILGMKERAARTGGSIVFAGDPGKGTNVRVMIPIGGTMS
jgi:signal transduction histidine kinase/ligand-binding sensor domain-containing protein